MTVAPHARRRVDPGRLHVLTDETLQSRHTHVQLAELAAAGGADVVQLRDKRPRTTAELVALASAVREAAARAGETRVVVNDRADVALAAGVDGVHLGADDLDPRLARRILGEAALIGATANDLASARRVAAWPVDYLGVGPLRATTSKGGRPARPLGLEGLARIARAVAPLPVIAIGGVGAGDVADVLEAGAWGVASLSAVACAPDPRAAAGGLRAALDAALAAGRGQR